MRLTQLIEKLQEIKSELGQGSNPKVIVDIDWMEIEGVEFRGKEVTILTERLF
jgi:hypothetical protein